MARCGACGQTFKTGLLWKKHIEKCKAAELMGKAIATTVSVGGLTTTGHKIERDELIDLSKDT